MRVPISAFEQYVDEAILKRGLSYFRKGKVTEVDELQAGSYEADVHGTEIYEVRLTVIKGFITEAMCTCPYDLGVFCKHLAALLFHIQQDQLGLSVKVEAPRKAVKGKPAKKRIKKTPGQQADDIIQKVDKDALGQFIMKYVEVDKQFLTTFLSFFAGENDDESIKYYADQVKAILKKAGGRGRFIHWNEAGVAVRSIHGILQLADGHLKNGNVSSALMIAFAVLKEVSTALEYADDSNGSFGMLIEESIDILYSVAVSEGHPDARQFLFDQCVDYFNKQYFKDWDWHIGLMKIASSTDLGEKHAVYLMDLLDKATLSEFQAKEAQLIHFDLLIRIGKREEAREYMMANLDIMEFRTLAIAEALEQGNFVQAIRLAEDGIKSDAELPGLVKHWESLLVEIAEKSGDAKQLIRHAKKVFIDNHGFDKTLYQKLKSNVGTRDWNGFLEGMIHEITLKKSWFVKEVLAEIYVAEEMWEDLLRIVSQTPTQEMIGMYGRYLLKQFPKPWAEIHGKMVANWASRANTRTEYRHICRYLVRMMKGGEKELGERLALEFRRKYAHRPAFMDELKVLQLGNGLE